ncbi:MAG: twin-arginine translocase subunit TatC [Planctomycetota bacterium]
MNLEQPIKPEARSGGRADAGQSRSPAGERRLADEKRMSFGEHLEELRHRLIVALVVIVAIFVLALIFQDQLFAIFTHPYNAMRASMLKKGQHDPGLLTIIKPTEGFVAYMEVAFYFSLLLGAPVLLYQMWQFIAAGLYDNEKRLVRKVLPFSLLLFALGLAFGYFVLLPMALNFLIGYSSQLQPQIRIDEYSSLLVTFILLMGGVFQLPLLMVVLDRVGLVKVEVFVKQRRLAIVINFVVAAVVTPPDYVSQLMVAVPLLLLYEIGILTARYLRRSLPRLPSSPPTKPSTDGGGCA